MGTSQSMRRLCGLPVAVSWTVWDQQILTFFASRVIAAIGASWEFHDALGQMRALFGVHIAQIAVRYRIDVEDNLARILPPLIDKEADKRGIDADS
jgi:hypothetical protein